MKSNNVALESHAITNIMKNTVSMYFMDAN